MASDNLALVHDEIIVDVQKRTSGDPNWKSFGCSEKSDYNYHDGVIEHKSQNGVTLDLQKTVFANQITGLTAAAVFAVSEYLSLNSENLNKTLLAFESLPHRMQSVCEYKEVLFIDDSKATNIAALIGALKMVSRPVQLIVGGQLKEKDISKPMELLRNRVKAVYCIGESASVFRRAWKDSVKCHLCGDIAAAVRMAWDNAGFGEVILLAPGCASFDQFSNYKDRGLQFQKAVKYIIDSAE